jgi:hypothetical protein
MKGAKIEIKIGGKGGEMMDKSPELEEVEMEDDALFGEMAPKGTFTPKGLNALVKSTNKLLPAFGQTPDYPTFADSMQVLPTDFVRVLAMFKAAVDDAIAEGILGEEMAIDLATVRDDLTLVALAGKLDQAARDINFKKFLKESPPEETRATEAGEEMGMEEEEMSDGEMDDLFMSKMGNYGIEPGVKKGKM